MSFAVNNNAVSLAAAIVFANSASYHVELPMAGREKESATLREALELDCPRLVTMTAPLGAGKTFFLDTVLRQFERDGETEFDEKRSRRLVLATGVEPPSEDPATLVEMDSLAEHWPKEADALVDEWDRNLTGEPKVLIVEEIDRKAYLGQIRWTVEAARRWLERSGNRLLILTGDKALLHPVLQEAIEGVEPRFDIALEPLDLALLREALQLRIRDKVVGPGAPDLGDEEAESLAAEAAEATVADAYVRWSALPSTEPNVLANFREALGALRQISELEPTDNAEQVEFLRAPLARLGADAEGAGIASKIEEALMRRLTESIAADTPIEPLSTEGLAESVDRPVDDKLLRRGVYPLNRLGVLTPLGIPFAQRDQSGEPIPYTEPFVPSYKFVHRALAELVKGEA